jgi:hypothetical protein
MLGEPSKKGSDPRKHQQDDSPTTAQSHSPPPELEAVHRRRTHLHCEFVHMPGMSLPLSQT